MINLNNARVISSERVIEVRDAAHATYDGVFAYINNLLIELLVYETPEEFVAHISVDQVDSVTGPNDINSTFPVSDGIAVQFEFACSNNVPNEYATKVHNDGYALFSYLVNLAVTDAIVAYDELQKLTSKTPL